MKQVVLTIIVFCLLFPCLAVVLSMTGLNLLGDGLRLALDPLARMKAQSKRPRVRRKGDSD